MLDALHVTSDQLRLVEGGLVVRTGPVSWRVLSPLRQAERLVAMPPEHALELPVRMEWPQDGDPVLVCFDGPEGRAVYDALKLVKGIGTKSALALLNMLEPLDVLRAVVAGDEKLLTSVPGIGPKSGAAIISTLTRRFRAALPAPLPVSVGLWVEARDALIATGVAPDRAEQALQRAVAAGDCEGWDAQRLVTEACGGIPA